MVVLVQPSMATVTRNNGDTSLMSGCGRVMQSISAGLQQNIIIVSGAVADKMARENKNLRMWITVYMLSMNTESTCIHNTCVHVRILREDLWKIQWALSFIMHHLL